MNHNRLQHLLYAAIAGICGSLAGLFGKIGMVVDKIFNKNQVIIVNIVRFLMIVLVILSNVGVWLMYTRSLQFGSTLISTGISIASNYIFTALAGILLFEESFSIMWACGILSIMSGVVLISV